MTILHCLDAGCADASVITSDGATESALVLILYSGPSHVAVSAELLDFAADEPMKDHN